MRPIFKVPAILCALWAFLLFVPSVWAQTPSQAPVVNAPSTIKSYVNEVLVPVVVRDAHGQSIGSLSKQDFQVFDEGKPQAITSFSLEDRGVKTPSEGAPVASHDSPQTEAQPASPGPRFVVFLFDDFNLDTGDLMQAQQAATKFLDASLPASDLAAVLSTSGMNSGATRDRAVLKKAILGLRVNSLYRHENSDCPNVDYYQGDLIINKNNDIALQAATEDAMTCAHLDPTQIDLARRMARQAAQRAVALGEQNYRSNLGFMKSIVSKMGLFPGQRLLILVSGGFLTPTAEALTLQSQLLDDAAQANVMINAIDARGLYTTSRDASETGGGSPLAARMQGQYKHQSMTANEDVMAELADGTGGTFFHNNNDLEAGLSSLFYEPRYVYLLSFSTVNVKPNGAYHGLKVKVDQPGINVKSRRGYFAPAPEKEKKKK